MRYIENFKKSQLKKIPTGYEMPIDCKEVLNVTNENSDRLKFSYNYREKVLTILEEKFGLLTIDYNS